MRECPFDWLAKSGEKGKEVWEGEYPEEIEVEGSNPKYSAWSGWDPGYYTVASFIAGFTISRLIEGDDSKWGVEGDGIEGPMGWHTITVSGDEEGPFWDEVEDAIDKIIELGEEDASNYEPAEPDYDDWDNS